MIIIEIIAIVRTIKNIWPNEASIDPLAKGLRPIDIRPPVIAP